MKTRTKISYVILKYDDQTDNIYTKTSNNENHVYEIPAFDYVQKRDANFNDAKTYILEKVIDFQTFVDENHIFIPFINVTFENGIRVYDYVAVIFESMKDTFSSMNYESWHRVKYDSDTKVWNLAWESGLTDPVDFKFTNSALTGYVANPKGDDKLTFNNVMHFVAEQTNDFPILGLLSGNKFTMKQVFHYQDLLGLETLKAGDNRTFENQYADSIQTIDDDNLTTSYKIKNDYLKK
ncbi:hypothetical protein [Companilactobacillus heilongjiangensis]|uniref:Uncharacterized protein n=1 Tax=Companilactobacillus heilongjiangensis TaxID=1074467 RepID=A0A0K2LAQ9_9LACO|nr:hypothetical protein [Companilactobacillus heilongjiangensis]ALB28355.1 hypothetical protein JP39_02560 [Companilactobacillus heilongjiangensis]